MLLKMFMILNLIIFLLLPLVHLQSIMIRYVVDKDCENDDKLQCSNFIYVTSSSAPYMSVKKIRILVVLLI